MWFHGFFFCCGNVVVRWWCEVASWSGGGGEIGVAEDIQMKMGNLGRSRGGLALVLEH